MSFIVTPFECSQVKCHALVRSPSWWRSCVQYRSIAFNALLFTGCLFFSRYKAVDSGSLPNFAGPSFRIQSEDIDTYLQYLHPDIEINLPSVYIAQLSWMNHHYPGFGNRQLPISTRINNDTHVLRNGTSQSGPCSSRETIQSTSLRVSFELQHRLIRSPAHS